MHFFAVFLALAATCCSIAAKPPEPKVHEGVWNVPLRYWSGLSPVLHGTGGFHFLCEVEQLGKAITVKEGEAKRQYRTGQLKVLELLSGDPAKFPSLSEVKVLAVEGCEGLKVGDQVLVLINAEPYEGGYVIDRHQGTNCHLGHRLARQSEFESEADFKDRQTAEKKLVELARSGKLGVTGLTSDQLRTLSILDPDGVRRGLIREIEIKELERELIK